MYAQKFLLSRKCTPPKTGVCTRYGWDLRLQSCSTYLRTVFGKEMHTRRVCVAEASPRWCTPPHRLGCDESSLHAAGAFGDTDRALRSIGAAEKRLYRSVRVNTVRHSQQIWPQKKHHTYSFLLYSLYDKKYCSQFIVRKKILTDQQSVLHVDTEQLIEYILYWMFFVGRGTYADAVVATPRDCRSGRTSVNGDANNNGLCAGSQKCCACAFAVSLFPWTWPPISRRKRSAVL